KSASAAILKVLSVSLHLDKNSVHPGDKQTITIRILDKNSSNTVAGASVVGRISSPVGPFKKVGGTTDGTGKASYYWTVKDGDTTGKYKVTTDVSASGYEKYSTTKTFKVTPTPVTTPQYSSFPSTHDNTNTNTKHHNHNHLPTIIPSIPDNTNTNINNNNLLSPPPATIIPSTHDNTNTNTKHHNHNHLPTIIPSIPDNTNINTNNNTLLPPPTLPSTTIPSTNSPVIIPNNNNNLLPTLPSTTIQSTNSPVIIPNNNNNLPPPPPTTPSTTVTSNSADKVPFLLPFH
ncbi:MAG: hypothetical protein DLM72_12600, partial [Candidatus Nitrosopolaris wilkensis]